MFADIFEDIFQPMFSDLFGLSKICQAIRFNGVNNYGTFANEISLSGDWSVEAAFNVSSTVIDQDLINKELFFKIRINSQGRFGFLVGNGTNWFPILTEPDGNNFDKYCVVLAEKIGTTYNLRVNGELRASVVRVEPVTPQISHVGRRSNSNIGWANGFIYYIRINNFYYAMDAVGQAIQPSLPAGNDMTLFNTVPEQWEPISCGLRPDVTPQALQTADGANVFTQDGQAVQVIDI